MSSGGDTRDSAGDLRRRSLWAAREWAFATLSTYWQTGGELVRSLPIASASPAGPEALPPRVEMVALPDWAADWAVAGGLLVPSAAVLPGDGPGFARTDWWFAAVWYLDGRAERAFEAAHGPIHSYSGRLVGWDPHLWDHAWVNRIALFLRRWASRTFTCDETRTFGPPPNAEILVTHDVDAVDKTMRIRFKQGAFHVFNAARALRRGDVRCAARKVGRSVRFAFGRGDYRTFDHVCAMEDARGIRSTFFVYASVSSVTSRRARLLFDPGYHIDDPAVAGLFRRLSERGWPIGLHPSYDTWADPDGLRAQKGALERVLGSQVSACRQHWLRFSWASTWAAQESADLDLDATLGFNDRPGFRNGAALRVCPLDDAGKPRHLASLPLALMDSHLYDYADPCEPHPERGIARWVDEIRAVGGVATVLWHPHVLSDDYGWASGYEELLRAVV